MSPSFMKKDIMFGSITLPVQLGCDQLAHGVDHLCGQVDKVMSVVFQDECRVCFQLRAGQPLELFILAAWIKGNSIDSLSLSSLRIVG